MQVWINGIKQLPDTSHAGNTFRIVLSNTAGNGSAFNGNGSKAALYDGTTLVGTYTLQQLASGDGYTRRKRTLSGMDFTVWTSMDLNDWTEDTTAAQTATDIPGTDNQSVEVHLSPALLTSDRLFVRVRVQ